MLTNESAEARLDTLERQMKRLLSDRSIGSALDGSFALKWPARVMGPEGDAYIIVRQPGGVLSSVPISEYSADDWTDGAYYSEIAIGTIWQYEGSESDIPPTWQLCDGTNGTPDLRDKFILGGALEDAGTTAAAQSTVIDAHSNHVVTQPSNHVVTQPSQHGAGTTGSNGATTSVNEGGGTPVAINTTSHTHSTPALSHTGAAVDAHSGTAVDAHSAHVVSTDYYPPYYKLAFIKKVA